MSSIIGIEIIIVTENMRGLLNVHRIRLLRRIVLI